MKLPIRKRPSLKLRCLFGRLDKQARTAALFHSGLMLSLDDFMAGMGSPLWAYVKKTVPW